MNICHRYLAQYMLKNGVATVNDALAYCNHISEGRIENMTQFKTLVIELNREISKQFYKIVFNTCEVTQRNIVVWLNTKNDDIAKHQISYSALELEYFHAILQEILATEEYRITFIVCINITSTLTTFFSRDNGQKVLNKWLKRGYYIKNGDFIQLGPRLILEFTSYLRTNCPDSICKLCSELVFTGKRCSNCNSILHTYCLSKYLENQTNCPCCKNIWEMSEEDVEGINMVTDQADYSTINTEEDGDMTLINNHMHYEDTLPLRQSSRRSQATTNSQDEEDSDDDELDHNLRKRHKRSHSFAKIK